MSMNQNAVLSFFRTRLRLFGQIVKTNNESQIGKTEQGFLTACLQYLPSVSRITPDTATEILGMLDDLPGMERMTDATKATVQESVMNITDQNELGSSHRQSFVIPETAAVTSGGTAGPSSSAHLGLSTSTLHAEAAAEPGSASAAAEPGSVSLKPNVGKLPEQPNSVPVGAEAEPSTTEKLPPSPGSTEAKPSTVQVSQVQRSVIMGLTKQSQGHIPNYLTEAEWNFFCSDKSDQSKAHVATKFIIRLALWKVPEGFYGCYAGLIFACNGRGADDSDFLNMVRWIKYYASQAKPANVEPASLHYDFPENPMDLPEPWRSRSQADGPTNVSRLSPSDWQFICQVSPSRSSHQSQKQHRSGPG
jgi:hypothetical protein